MNQTNGLFIQEITTIFFLSFNSVTCSMVLINISHAICTYSKICFAFLWSATQWFPLWLLHGLWLNEGPPWCQWRNHKLMGWLITWIHLTHWGRVTHMCAGKLTNIDSDNGLSPERRQAIIWTNVGILLIGHLETNCSEFLIKKMHLKMPSVKCRPFFLC